LHIVRYADDFVILSPSKDWIQHIAPDIRNFLNLRGLEINEKKTSIKHITDGFNFLGWEIRRRKITRDNDRKKRTDPYRQDSALIIRPRPEKIAGLKQRLKTDVFRNKEYEKKPVHIMFAKHNEIIRGWCCYYWTSYHSQEVFRKLANWQWYRLMRFFKRKHKGQKRSTLYIQKKYTKPHSGKESKTTKKHFRKWTWTVKRKDRRHPKGEKKFRILDPSTIKNKLVGNPKHGILVYTPEGRAYWEKWWNSEMLFTNSFRSDLHQRDNLKCAVCGQSAHYYGTENEYGEVMTIIELHHIEPWSKSGNDDPDNLITVHTECHPYYEHQRRSDSDDVTDKKRKTAKGDPKRVE
jgi:RNA-directed DNA polymerase